MAISGQIWYNKVLKLEILLYKLRAFSNKQRGSLEFCCVSSFTDKLGCAASWFELGLKGAGASIGSNSSSVSNWVDKVEDNSPGSEPEQLEFSCVGLWQLLPWFWALGVPPNPVSNRVNEDWVEEIEPLPSHCIILLMFVQACSDSEQ